MVQEKNDMVHTTELHKGNNFTSMAGAAAAANCSCFGKRAATDWLRSTNRCRQSQDTSHHCGGW